MNANITCPECGTVNSVPSSISQGSKLRCGKCNSLLIGRTQDSGTGSDLKSVGARLLSVEHRVSMLEMRMRSVTGEIGIEPAAVPDAQPVEPQVEKIAEHVVVLEDQPAIQHMDERGKPAASEAQTRVEPHYEPPVRQMDFGGVESAAHKTQPHAEPHFPSQRPAPPKRASEPPQFTKTLEKWEQALPGNWLSRIGAVALLIGLGFLAKLAYDNEWINSVTQLILGLFCGGVLLWGGQHWSQRYRVWAQALTGGGIGVLYLSFFASYALNELMSFFPTYALMFATTVLAVWLALRQNSMAIAIIGIAGAFLVPIILSVSGDSETGADTASHPWLLIAYILLLDAGILWLSTQRNWRWFTLLGWAGSLAVYGLWYADTGHDGSLLDAEGSLTAIFVFFAAATTVFHLIRRRVPQPTDLTMMSLNAAAYFGISYHIFWHDYHVWLGLFSFLLAGFYAVLGYIALRRNKENRTLSYFAFGIAIVFLTVAIPVQLHRSWITVGWAAEAAVLIWIASSQGLRRLQLCGLGIFGLVLIRLFHFDAIVDQASFRPVLDDSMILPFGVSIVAFYAAAYFLKRDPKVLQPWLVPLMLLLANFLTVFLFSSEIVNYADSRIIVARVGHDLAHIRGLENARSLSLVGLWAAYGLGLVTLGFRRGWDWLRAGGYALLTVAAGTTLIVLNYSHAMIQRGVSTPVLNYSFGSFAICIAAFGLSAYMVSKNNSKLHELEKGLSTALLIGASFLALWALSSEVYTFVHSADPRNNLRTLSLISLWAASGSALIVDGTRRDWTWSRVGGYALVALAAGTALVEMNYSHALIHRVGSHSVFNYSFGAFALSVIALYISTWWIGRNTDKLYEREKMLPAVLIVAANFLTLWAFSSEVLTFVGSGYGKSMGLTLLWAAYGLVLVAVGIAGKWRWVRLGGLALVSGAIIKLFAIDTFTLERGYRVAAYLTLGVLLLAGGFIYHKYADVIKGFIFDQTPKEVNSGQDKVV